MNLRILLFVTILFLIGCPAVDFKELNFTRNKPKKEDLVGTWIPNKESLSMIQTRGHYPDAKYEIVLRENGTFSINNIPDWWRSDFG